MGTFLIVVAIIVFVIFVIVKNQNNQPRTPNTDYYTAAKANIDYETWKNNKTVTVSKQPQVVSFNMKFDASQQATGKYFVFDCETTGLPIRRKAPATDFSNWPYIIQIAWAVFDEDGKVVNGEDFIIKQNVEIPYTATRIHGITTARMRKEGIAPAEVYSKLNSDLLKAQILVAHNIEFDLPILKCEMLRNGFAERLHNYPQFCTMQFGIDICKIPRSNGGFKYPKLTELFGKLFLNDSTIDIPDAHDAVNDMLMTAKCFFEMKKRNIDENLINENASIKYDEKNREVEKNKLIGSNKINGIDADFNRQNIFLEKNVVITGKFNNWNDFGNLASLIKLLGGKIQYAINNDTDVLICGKNPSPNTIETFQQLNISREKLMINSEQELLQIIDGQVLMHFEDGEMYKHEEIRVQNGVFQTVISSGSILNLQMQDFYKRFNELKSLEVMDIQSAIREYNQLADAYPIFKNRVFERLEIIYRKLKDYENEIRICQLHLDFLNLDKKNERLNGPEIEKILLRLDKATTLQLNNKSKQI